VPLPLLLLLLPLQVCQQHPQLLRQLMVPLLQLLLQLRQEQLHIATRQPLDLT
jgi:hypothetical protein